MPNTRAAMREVRAEGGWGVVNTGYCSIHPSSDDAPLPYCRLWNDDDIAVHELMVDAVHRHGSLAGVELWHGGGGTGNKMTRMPLMSVSGISSNSTYPGWINLARSRPMDKQDIREFRQWHVDAAVRAKSAGFDIIYVYAGMNFGPYQFLLPWLNERSDEYGGSLANRVRLTREIIEDMKAAVGDSCAIALRFSTDELLNVPGENLPSEAHEIISTLSDVPDLWDLKSSDWVVETTSARFAEQGAQEPWVSFAKSLTSKPVVGVGRFTSPDVMVSQIKRVYWISSVRPVRPSPILFCPTKSMQGARMRFASASAATFASLATMTPYRSGAHKTQPWARSGAATGTRNAYHLATRDQRVDRWRRARWTGMCSRSRATRFCCNTCRSPRRTRWSRQY